MNVLTVIHYFREGMLRGASSWEMFTYQNAPGFGFLASDAPQRRSMNYWLYYYYFNRHVGDWVLSMDGTAPYHEAVVQKAAAQGALTPAVTTLSADGTQLFLIVANGSWTREVPCRIVLFGFPAPRAKGFVLSDSDPDSVPFLGRSAQLAHELALTVKDVELQTALPPHSVAFVTVERGGK